MIESSDEYRKMAEVEGRHWWYVTLHDQVLKAIKKHSFMPQARILDAGCGTGGMLIKLRELGYTNTCGFDLSQDAVAYCVEHNLTVSQGNLTDLSSLYAGEQFDCIVSNDTLCYLEPNEIVDFFLASATLLRPAGVLILNLPALGAFSGIHDISVGLSTRFSRTSITDSLRNVPLQSLSQTYWPFFLSPVIYVVRLLQRLKLRFGKNVKIKSDIDLPSPSINRFLYALCRLENKLLRHKPFGSSLFVVLQKNAG